MIRKKTKNFFSKNKETKEDLPGDELIVINIKYGRGPKAIILRKIIIIKNGRNKNQKK